MVTASSTAASASSRRPRSARQFDHQAPVPLPDGGVARLLRPEAETVPFWPRAELGLLTEWVAAGEHAAVQLVVGPGGVGKTRLARRIARDCPGHWASAPGGRLPGLL